MIITDWKLTRNTVGSKPLAQILQFVKAIDQNKVTLKSLSGSIYIQTIGDGVKYADINIIATREEMEEVNKAEADGAVLSAVYRGVKHIGYIEDAPSWSTEVPGEWYTATFRFLIEQEVVL